MVLNHAIYNITLVVQNETDDQDFPSSLLPRVAVQGTYPGTSFDFTLQRSGSFVNLRVSFLDEWRYLVEMSVVGNKFIRYEIRRTDLRFRGELLYRYIRQTRQLEISWTVPCI